MLLEIGADCMLPYDDGPCIYTTLSMVLWLSCAPRVRKIVDSGLGQIKGTTIKLAFAAPPLNTQI